MERHSVITQEMVPPQIAQNRYVRLLRADPSEVGLAIEWVHDEKETVTLSLSDCAKALERFASSRKTRLVAPVPILEALFTLEGLRFSLHWSGQELIDFLDEAAKEEPNRPAADRQMEIKALLLKYFSNTTKLERTLKAQRIYDGLVPNFDSCWSLVEFRPVYNELRNQIVNGIIVGSLSIQVRQSGGEEEPRTISFQLDIADIETITKELARLKMKVGVLREMVEEKTTLVNPTMSLKESDEL